MSENILETIISVKKNKINKLKETLSVETLEVKIKEINSFIDFKKKNRK